MTDPKELTDGYHTMAELYEHRHALFCALIAAPKGDNHNASFKSWRHSDGELCFGGGWFVAGLYLKHTGQLVTYHLPEAWWEVCPAAELETAPPWDGHTSEDVLARLKQEGFHG